MPKGLKQTSSQLIVSFSVEEQVAGGGHEERIDLQLNALDNEVFVVTGVKLDTSFPDINLADPVANFGGSRLVNALVSKQELKSSVNKTLGNPSVFASSTKELRLQLTESLATGQSVAFTSEFSEDHVDSPFNMDYLDIIATPDFFVTVIGKSNFHPARVNGKVYGYRAKADAATYAALVQSELISMS
tara:strand:- start:94 stop:657 length:564 start_codon:yes stop_codon:yes gene_type:complete